MIKRLAAAILLALPMSAFALSNSFSYQGSLNDGGTPASGSYDLQFQLQTSAGVNVGAPLVREDVAVAAGLFSVELDVGAAITSAVFRLQIGVRPGASVGAFGAAACNALNSASDISVTSAVATGGGRSCAKKIPPTSSHRIAPTCAAPETMSPMRSDRSIGRPQFPALPPKSGPPASVTRTMLENPPEFSAPMTCTTRS